MNVFGHASALVYLATTILRCEAQWTYGAGVASWGDVSATCLAMRQSPIDLAGAEPRDLGDLVLQNYDQGSTGQIIFKNTGYGITVENLLQSASVSGGGLPSTYNLLQWHWHWGPSATTGSEHTVNGRRYAMELHLVYTKSGFTVQDALGLSDGVAVLGILIEEDDPALPCNDQIFADMTALAETMSTNNDTLGTLNVVNFRLDSLLPADRSTYYRYLGSLTTPNCVEAVVWTVFATPVKQCASDINKWRTFRGFDRSIQLATFRPLQNSTGRAIYMNQRSGGAGPSSGTSPTTSLFNFF